MPATLIRAVYLYASKRHADGYTLTNVASALLSTVLHLNLRFGELFDDGWNLAQYSVLDCD